MVFGADSDFYIISDPEKPSPSKQNRIRDPSGQKNSGMFPSRPESSGANTIYTTIRIRPATPEINYFRKINLRSGNLTTLEHPLRANEILPSHLPGRLLAYARTGLLRVRAFALIPSPEFLRQYNRVFEKRNINRIFGF